MPINESVTIAILHCRRRRTVATLYAMMRPGLLVLPALVPKSRYLDRPTRVTGKRFTISPTGLIETLTDRSTFTPPDLLVIMASVLPFGVIRGGCICCRKRK